MNDVEIVKCGSVRNTFTSTACCHLLKHSSRFVGHKPNGSIAEREMSTTIMKAPEMKSIAHRVWGAWLEAIRWRTIPFGKTSRWIDDFARAKQHIDTSGTILPHARIPPAVVVIWCWWPFSDHHRIRSSIGNVCESNSLSEDETSVLAPVIAPHDSKVACQAREGSIQLRGRLRH